MNPGPSKQFHHVHYLKPFSLLLAEGEELQHWMIVQEDLRTMFVHWLIFGFCLD
jgi:hypothetical protein